MNKVIRERWTVPFGMRRGSIYYRIFMTTAAVMVLTLAASSIVSLIIFTDILERRAADNVSNILEQTNKLIDQRLGGLVNTSQQIFSDSDIIDLLHKIPEKAGYQDDPYFSSLVNPKLYKYILSDPGILSLMLVNRQKNWFIPSVDFDYFSSGVEGYIRHYNQYSDDYFTRGILWIPTHPVDYASREDPGGNILKLVRDIYDSNLNYAATLVINVKERSLYELFESIKIPAGTFFYVLDEKGNVISSTDSKEVGRSNVSPLFARAIREQNGSFTADFRGKSRLFVFRKLKDADWTTVGAVPVDEMLKDQNRIVKGISLLVVVLLVFSVLGTWMLTYSISRPIRRLIVKMKQVKDGNLDVQVDIRSKDEIGLLSHTFNTMIYRIHELLNQLNKSHLKEREAEMRALQANINPHFLYNTLESVIWLAENRNYDDITKIVSMLGRYYRLSLSRGMDIVKVRDELAHVENYLSIEQMRYGDKFTYRIEVDPELYEYPCLKLILQPIVENSVHHGILPMKEKGWIDIRGRISGDHISITVTDNGCGIPRERLQEINEYFRTGRSLELPNSYGIKNVNERIQLKYGPDYGLIYESEEGSGTKVEIVLPVSPGTDFKK